MKMDNYDYLDTLKDFIDMNIYTVGNELKFRKDFVKHALELKQKIEKGV